MPTVHVEMLEGRTPEQMKALVQALTDAMVRTLDVQPGSVHVIVSEVRRDHWATGGVLWSEKT